MPAKVHIGTGVDMTSKERNENYRNAAKELTRADHLLYVSLKYSRTVDVIQSIVNRLVESCKFVIISALEDKVDEDELKKYSHGNAMLVKGMLKYYPTTQEFIDHFNFLRKLNKAEVKQRLNEYRKHLTLVTDIDGKEVKIKVEDIIEYYEKVKDFLKVVNKYVHGDDDDLLSLKN